MPKTKRSKRRQPQRESRKRRSGRQTAADSKDDLDLMHQIFESRRLEGLTYAELEIKFGLRRANGMTAHRLVRAYEKIAMDD